VKYSGSITFGRTRSKCSFEELLSWADEFRRLGVKANADTPEDAALARKFGAEGIGLTRMSTCS